MSLAYARQQVLKDHDGTKPSLNMVQSACCKASLRTVTWAFRTKCHDASRPELELQPNNSMRPRHHVYAITVLWRNQHTDGLLHFLANEKESKLHLTIEGQSFSEVIHLFDAPTISSRPLGEHLDMVAPEPRRLHLRVHAPSHLMSADATARRVLGHFAVYEPEATLIFDHDGVLTLRAIELRINVAVLSHELRIPQRFRGLRCVIEERKARATGHPLRRHT
jgi:hypothetical protein